MTHPAVCGAGDQHKNIILKFEDMAEFDYRPTACDETYRMVVRQSSLGRT